VRKLIGALCVFLVGVAVAFLPGFAGAHTDKVARSTCSSGYVDAIIGGEHKCLHAGEFCSTSHEADYERYGFTCVGGRLQTYSKPATTTATTAPSTTTTPPSAASTTTPPEPATTPATPSSEKPALGRTILLARRTRSKGCSPGANPDRRCSPGAYSSKLTRAVICSPGFHTSAIRNVPESEKFAVEREYRMKPGHYGRNLEIDHIVSLELGGSNDISNLFPERLNAHPGYRVKDRLENRVHALVCAGSISLRVAQRSIAANWQALYERVFGVAPA
jgi:hypothetical protein